MHPFQPPEEESKPRYAVPLQSFIDTTFFQKLSSFKLDVAQLNTDRIPLYARIYASGTPKGSPSTHLFLNQQCFDERNSASTGEATIGLGGSIYNFNVLEQFKQLDKKGFINEQATLLYEAGKKDINECVGFCIISFADLKKYRYFYWVCVPSYSPSNVEFTILKSNVTTSFEDNIKKWFVDNPSKWVCLLMEDGSVGNYSTGLEGRFLGLCLRDLSNVENVPGTITKNFLTILNHDYPDVKDTYVFFYRGEERLFGQVFKFSKSSAVQPQGSHLKVGGWERDMDGKLSPKMMDLSSLIDPIRIAEQAVDLNLKLMKWRVAPDIDLDVIRNTKTLLLGSGTLGCYVARALMAWGVRNITLVDNGSVSFSNPVRQPLFEFKDCGEPKAETAAANLRKIFPSLNALGVRLSIPMIGHPVVDEEVEREAYEKLVALVEEHDVIFLLMDSRETRWLPTVLGNAENKIVINAALGFDSYLVMRHGNYKGESAERLGCYFCQDVVVPTDSLKDKTLDQMCTVTRPGVAMLAASQAVELLVTMLQSKQKSDVSTSEETALGCTPHQIRGFLHTFSSIKLETPAYEHCSACSPQVVEESIKLGWEFVKRSLNDPEYIDNLSGLAKVKNDIDNMEKVLGSLSFSESDDEDVLS